MTLPELAIRRHVTTLMLLISLVVLGGVALTRLPLAHLPDMEEPELFVRFAYPNASPEQVEYMIVRPAEEVLASVNGLREMWSRCGDEGGMVRLEFDWSTDMGLARVEVWEKIDRIRGDLPSDIEDITVRDDWNDRESDDPILEIRLSSKIDLSESYDILDRRIVKVLQRVPGVAQVRLDGVNPKEVLINLRLADLELHRMEVREVSRILRGTNFNQSLGKITEGERRYTLRTVGSFATVDEIRELVLRRDGLRLSDVADVVYEEPDLDFGRHLDGQFAVGLTVSAESTANTVEVCALLDERIRKLNDDPKLKGVKFLVWDNQGQEIQKTLGDLFSTGVFGTLLASIVLYFFLRRFTATLVSVSCIPFSLIVTCGFIWFQGKTLNTMTLLGLIVGVGMLVDNAVVVIENIFRHHELGRDRKTASRLGAREVSTAVIAATLTSVIVFLPIVFNKPSKFGIPLREIGVTVCFTLLASLFVSQTLIPMSTSWFISSRVREKARWMLWLETTYVRMLKFNLRHRWVMPLIAIAIGGSAIYPFQRVDWSFSSHRQSMYGQIIYKFSEEVTLEKKEATITEVENFLTPHKEALNARSIYSWWSDGFTMTRVYLEEGTASTENLVELRQKLRELLPEIPGVKLEVVENRRSWRHDSGKRVAFQIVGDSTEVLAEIAADAREKLDGIEGLSESFVSDREGQQELHVALDRSLVARYDVSPQALADTVGLTFRGQRLQRFRIPEGEREMRLSLDERETESLPQLYNLPTWTPAGERLPLASVANFRELPGQERIERSNRLTSVWVGASYKEGTREQYIPQVVAALGEIEFPAGYSWTFGSWQERQQRNSREFVVNLLLALILVFAVMASLFESIQQAIALMISLPFALAGAFWCLYLVGVDFDQPAAVGILLLIGIVVNNGIVMIEHINVYQRRGMTRYEALIKGGEERLRPIVMTAVTTLIGLTPIVIQQPSLAGYNYYSMALVLMGGLAVSTVLTTVLLPTTVTLVEDGTAWLARKGVGVFRRGKNV